MSFTVYTSNDDSAPTLDQSKGSLVSLLEAVLVNGYGNKSAPSPSWTINKSSDGLHAVFQSSDSAASGNFFYIRDDGENDGDPENDVTLTHGREAYLKGATGFNGFTDNKPDLSVPFPTSNHMPRGFAIGKGDSSSRGVVDWWIVANQDTVYIQIHGGGTELKSLGNNGSFAMIGFGDLIELANGAKKSFTSANPNINDTNPDSSGLIGNDQSSITISVDSKGNNGTQLDTVFSSYIRMNEGQMSPSMNAKNVNDLSGPFWSLDRMFYENNVNESVATYRVKGLKEISIDTTNNLSDFFKGILGLGDSDDKITDFTFGSKTLIALEARNGSNNVGVTIDRNDS